MEPLLHEGTEQNKQSMKNTKQNVKEENKEGGTRKIG